MLNAVEEKSKSFANASAQTYYNLLGFLPAPFLYGFLNSLSNQKNPTWGMIVLMNWGIFGFISLLIAFFADRKVRLQLKKKSSNNKFSIENSLIIK